MKRNYSLYDYDSFFIAVEAEFRFERMPDERFKRQGKNNDQSSKNIECIRKSGFYIIKGKTYPEGT